MESLIFLVIMGALMWLLLIRPQQKRVQAQRQMVAAITVGQRVITAGGIIGTVVAIDGEEMEVEVDRDTRLRMLKGAVARPYDPAAITSGEEEA
jgi:preprotein translocase subunit YajC